MMSGVTYIRGIEDVKVMAVQVQHRHIITTNKLLPEFGIPIPISGTAEPGVGHSTELIGVKRPSAMDQNNLGCIITLLPSIAARFVMLQ